jgi:hypothetical protein
MTTENDNNTQEASSVQRIVRRLSAWAWDEMLWDVGLVEWKYGRTDDGKPKNWTEWNNVRVHLREAGKLRQPQELDSPNVGTEVETERVKL